MSTYKTQLSNKEEFDFLKWYSSVALANNLDANPDHPDHHYDYRGFWKNSSLQDRLDATLYSPDRHFPDTYKTPFHPTFSKDSIYSTEFMPGGSWDGENFIDSEWTKSRGYTPQLSDLIDFIKSYEDFSETPYPLNGQMLIGYGFADADLIAKGKITKQDSDQIITKKVQAIESELINKVPNWNLLNRGTQLALIDIAYNGNGAKTIYEQSPRLMALLKSGDFTPQQLAQELDHSKNAKGWLGVRSAARRAMVTGHYYWNSPNKDIKGRHIDPSLKSDVDSETSPYRSFKLGGNIRKFQSGGSTREVYQLSTIPTNNKVIVIDNYSPNYNYIVEGDKLYYARKGRDYWVDISDNDQARQNLLKHLSQYDFKGYDDNERSLWKEDPQQNSIPSEPLVSEIKKSPTSGTPPFEIPKEIPQFILNAQNSTNVKDQTNDTPNWKFGDDDMYLTDQWGNQFPMSTVTSNHSTQNDSNSIKVPSIPISFREDYNFKIPTLKDFGLSKQLIINGIRRKWDKWFPSDEKVVIVEPPELDSEYAIRPGVQISDTLTRKSNYPSGRYFLSEFIPGDAYTYAGRNRGDLTPVSNTEGAPITLIHPLLPYGSHVKPDLTYIGYDSKGNLKAGIGSDFEEGDVLSKSWRNQIIRFETDASGNVVGVHKNKNRSFLHPVSIFYGSDGTIKTDKNTPSRSAVNIMYTNPDNYGSVEGGRVLIQTGPEMAIVSGSMNTINKKFEEMKKRNGVDSGYFYTLDNGSYAMGLRTKNKKFTRKDLELYDAENVNESNTGAHIMYITGTPADKFPSDTVWTPNIRTVESESYQKGHGLKNEQTGVLLHHTAFMGDPNLTHVTNHFLNPKSEASSHVVIGEDGKRRVFATPDKVTFHAGASFWNGRSNVNDFMVGIEFQGDTTQKPLTDAQIQSAVEYLKPIIRENNIRLEDIVTHEQVRNLYNQYRTQYNLGRKADSKCDITLSEYERIINALKEQVYYKK